MAERVPRKVEVKISVDSSEFRALLERVREVVREELAAHDRKNAETIRKGVTLTPNVKISSDLSSYVEGVGRTHYRGNQA